MKRNAIHVRAQVVVVFFCLLVVHSLPAEEEPRHTSTFDQTWLKTLVSIEVWEPNGPEEPEKKPKSIASGFLVKTPANHLALVTAKHVVFDKNNGWRQRADLAYRLNRKEGRSDLLRETFVAQHRPGGWFKSERHDVACCLMGVLEGISDVVPIPYSRFLIRPEIEAGAPVFIIGFPRGLRDENYAEPILRYGIIARADPDILVDGFTFGGNSGGPVIYAPSTPLGKTLRSNILQEQWLVGLVAGHITTVVTDPNTKEKTEEHLGLCNIVPASAILELLESTEFKAVEMQAGQREPDRDGKQPTERRLPK